MIAVTCLGVATRAGASEPPEMIPEGGDEAAQEGDPLFEEEPQALPSGFPVSDPLEPGNRVMFAFNRQLDRWVWSPITRAYRFVTPEPARRGIRRALRNLNTPVYVANHVLQLRWRDAAETLGAFALNSTLGILGFLEPSKEAGWEARPADFGQTMGLVGIGSGPYLVIPVLGPTTARDGIGSGVDYFLQPLNYILGVPTQLVWGGGAGLSVRDEVADQLSALEKSSVDFYSVMRSAYQQNRAKELADARERRNADLVWLHPRTWGCVEDAPHVAQD